MAAFMVGLDDEIVAVSSGGVTIRMEVRQISSQGRDATGVRVMNLDDGQTVASVAPILASATTDRQPRPGIAASQPPRCLESAGRWQGATGGSGSALVFVMLRGRRQSRPPPAPAGAVPATADRRRRAPERAADAAALVGVIGGHRPASESAAGQRRRRSSRWTQVGSDVVVEVRVGDAVATARATNVP